MSARLYAARHLHRMTAEQAVAAHTLDALESLYRINPLSLNKKPPALREQPGGVTNRNAGGFDAPHKYA